MNGENSMQVYSKLCFCGCVTSIELELGKAIGRLDTTLKIG